MNQLLKLEQLSIFLLALLLFSNLDYDWWIFPACLLFPDLSMLGYLVNPRIGAWCYNLFHHKATAVLAYAVGFWLDNQLSLLSGVILLAHAAMDRVFGYGLKYTDDFKHTHLGWIGKITGNKRL